jgi:hypothetical protein
VVAAHACVALVYHLEGNGLNDDRPGILSALSLLPWSGLTTFGQHPRTF